jgi:hypothetical protein
MIRRTPTMIPMSDSDVQEIRDRVAEQKAQFEAKQKKLTALKKGIEEGKLNEHNIPALKQLVATARDERHKRLGIPEPGPSTSGTTYT